MLIYRTNEYKGYGKQNYYWNEYRQKRGEVSKYKCHREKVFDGNESTWRNDEQLQDSWKITDSLMPEWLKDYIK